MLKSLKNEKGVTITILVIAVILMLIIFGITINTGTDLIKNSEVTKTKSNLLLIKVRAKSLFEDYLFNGTDTYNLGDDITDETKITRLYGENAIDSSKYIYKIWNNEKLEKEGIDTSEIASGEDFIVQYNIETDDVDVATTKGVKDKDGNVFYKLSTFN